MLIRNIGELCTCDPARGEAPGVIRAAAIAAHDGVIAAVGTEHEVVQRIRGDTRCSITGEVQEIDAGGAAVVPGFVDAHTHIVWLGDRSAEYAQRASGVSYEAIAASGGGIRATVSATARGTLDDLVAAASVRARRMRAEGSTTIEVKSGYGVELEAELRQLDAALAVREMDGMPDVITTYMPLHAVPPHDREQLLSSVISTGLSAARHAASFVDVFCDSGAFRVEECEPVLRAAQRSGYGVKVHAEQRTHSGGAALAARLGAVSADHLEHATDDDMHALAAAGVTGVILPGASLVLGGPPPPGRALIDAGVTLAVATDCNPGTCYSESMPLMLSLAVATAGVTPAEALCAATRGGAAALGLPDRGVLRAGLRCDVAILDTPHWIDVAYHLGGCVVRTTVRAGDATLD